MLKSALFCLQYWKNYYTLNVNFYIVSEKPVDVGTGVLVPVTFFIIASKLSKFYTRMAKHIKQFVLTFSIGVIVFYKFSFSSKIERYNLYNIKVSCGFHYWNQNMIINSFS